MSATIKTGRRATNSELRWMAVQAILYHNPLKLFIAEYHGRIVDQRGRREVSIQRGRVNEWFETRARLALGTSNLLLHLQPVPAKGTTLQFQVTSVTPSLAFKIIGGHIATQPNALIVPPDKTPPHAALGKALTAHFSARTPADPVRASTPGWRSRRMR